MARSDHVRPAGQLRAARIQPHYLATADGSCLITMGQTRVICTASFVPGVPGWLAGKSQGWLTAEYGMLPASTGRRKSRPVGKPDSRATEIQRLIGRALRSVINVSALGENTLYLDCDVLTADGGTRTAAITGAYVALVLAQRKLLREGKISPGLVSGAVAAVSVGIVDGRCRLDLDYALDVAAEVDMNVAMTDSGKFVEIQGTAEHAPFDQRQLSAMLRLARGGIRQLLALQRKALGRRGGPRR
jgi:ribonuclease PH